MTPTWRVRGALALVLVLAGGCQDYNFNPVGHCVIQPGSEQVTLSSISTADVLFVVDDSGSMGGKQAKLAASFSTFINNLDQANVARVTNGLEPFDFHIAVTSTSVFWNYGTNTNTLCRSDCTGAAGQLVCCDGTNPVLQPKACTPGVTVCPGGTTCGPKCTTLLGENYCCDQSTGSFPAGSLTDLVPCTRAGALCGSFDRHFNFSACNATTGAGTGANQWPYPRGDFVSWTGGAAPNPRVLHFDKQLYTGTTNRQGFTHADLISFFSGGAYGGGTIQGNALTGTCGSNEEQGLNAARLALEKAVAGQQKDTYSTAAGKVVTWDPATRTATSPAEWLHPNAKLVLVFVGDEDDCSAPEDPSAGVVMGTGPPGNDACVHDQDPTNLEPNGHKLYDVVTRFVDYFTSLGRPVGAAFIESLVSATSQTTCSGTSCVPGLCCQQGGPTDCQSQPVGVCVNLTTTPSDPVCGGQAPGNRFMQLANELRGRGADVVAGSICDPNFGGTLAQIADIVKPPSGLVLPTLPAQSDITLLRIADTSGKTRKLCGRPLGAGTYGSLQAAQATGADWWFTAAADVTKTTGAWDPVAVSQFVYINPQGKCIANPGETYSADYLGRLPAGGCRADAECVQKLGGAADAWTCYAGIEASGLCVDPATSTQPGTCICGARSKNCPNG